ncbi:hypothetical protein IMCC21906_01491 [Spongiibacter sp. IMCC21906]|jgi:cadmium resistance protein CadD (predicted permease)|uniref:hypothetical protein n=1 Tax=Spongiibacter sp. IMCC21906 TaxID=1620392 RepID=UPI00062DEE9F|nr:hypothetical protein [Spongiibacter sp. IMCC21906]AKH69169.1 hypothetical protein IMCC21906_01491 [Spongiibacter sp. IMCC21906]
MNLLIIIAVLMVALLVIVPLIEKYSPQPSPETQQRMSRWILPLVGLGLVLALARQCMGPS